MPKQIEKSTWAGTSDASVQKATGKKWSDWIAFLDKNKGENLAHKDLVALLSKKIDRAWWCQKIANGYEQCKGQRTIGQTSNQKFQIGVSKTVDIDKDALWELLSSQKGIQIWLGKTKEKNFDQPNEYLTSDGISGKITIIKHGSHFRLTWKPKDWKEKSILQIRTTAKDGKSVLSFHQEGLPSSDAREQMKTYWTEKLNQLLKLIKS